MLENLLAQPLVVDRAYRIEDRVFGDFDEGAFTGTRLRDGLPVHLSILASSSVPMSELETRFSFNIPGFQTLLYAGPLFPDARGYGAQAAVLVERAPEGVCIDRSLVPLDARLSVEVTLGFCNSALAASRSGQRLFTSSPRTIWFSLESRTAAVMPRLFPFLQTANFKQVDGEPPFGRDVFIAPSDLARWDPNHGDDAYVAGLLLAWLAQGRHPFARKSPDLFKNQIDHMLEDLRDPFTGPPPIGDLLDCVLIADPDRRISLAEFRDELERLAKTL